MGKVAVVTGASKGIGAATAIAFGNEGYTVVVNYNTDKESAEKVATATGNGSFVVQADICTEEGVNKLFDAVEKHFKKIDVLVNNVGLPKEPKFGDYTYDAVGKSLAGNVTSAVLCTQRAVPLMNEGGSILFTSSIYGLPFGANPALVLYSAGKAAIISFAQAMAEKLAPKIRFNVVAPGTTMTPAWDNADSEYVTKSLEMTLQKEWVAAEDIADSFVFLAKNKHMNAQTVVVDCGWQKKQDIRERRR
jgi:NAD(P)-dependent dehydrogenase (short-subunit alcohol dehydrogenase family)